MPIWALLQVEHQVSVARCWGVSFSARLAPCSALSSEFGGVVSGSRTKFVVRIWASTDTLPHLLISHWRSFRMRGQVSSKLSC